MGIGRFKISYALLKELLYLPDDAEIVGVDREWPGGYNNFYVYIEHKDLPPMPKHGCIPDGEIVFKRNPPVEFIEWKMYE